MEAEDRKIVLTPESQKKKWDQRRRDPTFTELAGSLAYLTPETLVRDILGLKRRETIFEEAGNLETTAFAKMFHLSMESSRAYNSATFIFLFF